MNVDRKKYTQVQCPACGYRMPLFFTEEAECKGVQVACKGESAPIFLKLK